MGMCDWPRESPNVIKWRERLGGSVCLLPPLPNGILRGMMVSAFITTRRYPFVL